MTKYCQCDSFFTTQYDSAWFRAPLPLSSVPPHCDASDRIYPAGFLHSWVTSPTSPTPFLLSPSWCPPSLCGIPTPSIWLHPSFSPSLTSFPAQVIANRKKSRFNFVVKDHHWIWNSSNVELSKRTNIIRHLKSDSFDFLSNPCTTSVSQSWLQVHLMGRQVSKYHTWYNSLLNRSD